MKREELIKSLKRGERQSIDYIYNQYSLPILRFINSYLFDKELSKDVLQETFISLWDSRNSISDETQVDRLLFTIAKNKTLNTIRSKRNRQKHTVSEYTLSEYITIESLASHTPVSLEEDDLASEIEALYGSLPDIYKETFNLNRLEGLTYREIAESLNISQKAVEKRISKVLSVMRENVGKIYFFTFMVWLSIFNCVIN